MALIALDDVSKIYPKGTRPALDGINLSIERGDFVFLVGASGSGKTTLLSLLLREDKAAEREYVTGHVAANSKQFDSTAERLDYLISNQYYNPAVFNQYSAEFLDRIYEHVESAGFEFGTFLGAFKFYTSYALKTFDGRLYLEDFPQRCTAVALELAAGNEQQAIEYADEMLAGRFQPATPTFLNLGKAQRGEPVSCFLVPCC